MLVHSQWFLKEKKQHSLLISAWECLFNSPKLQRMYISLAHFIYKCFTIDQPRLLTTNLQYVEFHSIGDITHFDCLCLNSSRDDSESESNFYFNVCFWYTYKLSSSISLLPPEFSLVTNISISVLFKKYSLCSWKYREYMDASLVKCLLWVFQFNTSVNWDSCFWKCK